MDQALIKCGGEVMRRLSLEHGECVLGSKATWAAENILPVQWNNPRCEFCLLTWPDIQLIPGATSDFVSLVECLSSLTLLDASGCNKYVCVRRPQSSETSLLRLTRFPTQDALPDDLEAAHATESWWTSCSQHARCLFPLNVQKWKTSRYFITSVLNIGQENCFCR